MGEAEGKLHWCLQEDCESKSGPFDEPSEWVCVCERERETSVVVGDVGHKVRTMSCEVSKSWGGMCSMLTIVNPILLLHSGNMSGECIVSVFTTHKT